MAPIRPFARAKSKSALPSGGIRKSRTSNYPSTPSNSSFSTTKKDKRIIKHSVLLSKIQKSAPRASKKRRRPSKKLLTTLESLADALPEQDAVTVPNSRGNLNEATSVGSLKSKPGVRRKREKMEKAERERFGKNLAVLSQARVGEKKLESQGKEEGASGTSERWKALRAHIEASMERAGG